MAYTEADTRAKLIDPQIKSSNWLESNIVREYYFTDGRKFIGMDRTELREAFEGAVNIRERYFGLQREIYRLGMK
ncbi:hypothetical protein YH65_04390 [Sulfurovum lithotrophicum]|uniref:Uncharacterized protein n=1 Tax=Sulfurovum lithotrophicum TaxID=206403 RepID=A0A7U4M0Q8_9BACT|nr:hypothetical protein [Sulfurovum lithotrophicum]AKF24708.1 hypothetical protein YH65_04390 [Sulfurovum lithotrophicum]